MPVSCALPGAVALSERDGELHSYDKTNSGNQRLVVMAKLLPEGAAAQEFTVSLAENPELP